MSVRLSLARVLLVCPHPDDETLGAGLLVQEVLARGGQVHVLYLTDGENNPIPQFLNERRWPFGAESRARWGARRRAEAREALRILGVTDGATEHWSLPDQGLAHLADAGTGVVASLVTAIQSFAPTTIIAPSARDLHCDHAAAALLVRRAVTKVAGCDIAHLVYRVHGARPALDDAYIPPLSLPALNRKNEALSAHVTQLVASRRRLRHLASRPEALWPWETDILHEAQSWRGLRRLLHLLPIWTMPEAEWDDGAVAPIPVEES